MSRIGKKPVKLPAGVKVSVAGDQVTIEGKLGKLAWGLRPEVSVAVNEGDKQVEISRKVDDRTGRAMHGLTRAMVANMVKGVSEGYEKKLEIVGVGYKAELKGKDLQVAAGYSRPIMFKGRPGITYTVENQTKIIVEGIDKELVGQTASEIRKIRKPEPYKGKGIKYVGERIRRKAGKIAGK